MNKKFAIVTGRTETPIRKTAIEELTKILLDYTGEYPLCLSADEKDVSAYRCIYIGMTADNPYIDRHSEHALSRGESYRLTVRDDTVYIEGFDEAGVLYGVLAFYDEYLVRVEHPDDDRYVIDPFTLDTLPDFDLTSAPETGERGLWTWGHVVYDYRGYLEHMMKLKMNRVIFWNDHTPFNAADIVEYAHARNIKIYWGFPWLWDTNFDTCDFEHPETQSASILAEYEKQYAHTCADGIYFQTFTELAVEYAGDICIAEAATRFVNHTSALFFEKYPNLDILFGLHATSVKSHLNHIASVDPRIRIVWENCGAFPFSYIPKDVESFDATKAFVRQAAALRGANDRFGVVTKGLVKLDWSQFEHPQGAQCIGVSSKEKKNERVLRKHKIWRYIQAYWLTYADKALEMVREMVEAKGGDLCIYALVEDGMFEEEILYPVALYAQMLWSCKTELKETMSVVAMREYVHFA